MFFRYSHSSFQNLKLSEAVDQKNGLIPALGKLLMVPYGYLHFLCCQLSLFGRLNKALLVRWCVTSSLSFKLLLLLKALQEKQEASTSCWVWCCIVKGWRFLSSSTGPGSRAADNLCMCKCIHMWWDSPPPKAARWLSWSCVVTKDQSFSWEFVVYCIHTYQALLGICMRCSVLL